MKNKCSQFAFAGLLFVLGCSHAPIADTMRGVASFNQPATMSCETSAENMVAKNSALAIREECTVFTASTSQKVYLLKIKGTTEDIGYYHGYLLADRAADGLIKDLTAFIEHVLSNSSHPGIGRTLLKCFSRRVEKSSTPEFNRLTAAFIRGFKEGLKYKNIPNPWSDEHLQILAVVTDAGIALDSFQRRMELKDPRAIADLVRCEVREAFGGNKMRRMPHPGGCTGFTVPEQFTSVRSMIHGRNLDGDLIESFQKSPTVFLFDETASAPAGKKWYRYVGAATAGLFYPGGISGFNEAGLAVSLHEMQTTESKIDHDKKNGNMGPYLQQRILREAATIDEAFEIAKNAGSFTGWTIFISDAVRGESASIELSGHRARLAKRVKGKPRAQANHFYHEQMQDQFYNYNFNKYLESRARDRQVESILASIASGSFGMKQALDLISNHQDADVNGGEIRSFGRTVVKAYTSLSTIALSSPNSRQIWISSGDRYPMPHSNFAGFQVDFDNFNFKPLGVQRTKQYDRLPNWDRSLDTYTRARIEHEHGNTLQAIEMLNRAVREAELDGKYEPAYHFIKARILIEAGEKSPRHYAEALKEFDIVLARPQALDQYGYLQALANVYSVYASDKSAAGSGQSLRSDQRDLRASQGLYKLQELHTQFKHFDLIPKIEIAERLVQRRAVDELPDIDAVVIDN